ncbi:hypothetical protein [Streptomyces collinus]|uniref:hypothetical protein n=1 Tax=Streptomyces collinus TaxID=42684 RepID=UPI00363EC700
MFPVAAEQRNTELTHVVGGALKGTAGLLNFVRGLNPTDPYDLTHPAAYVQNVTMTPAGLVSTAAHPERVVQAAVDGFKKDPSEFVGRLIPELVGTKGAGLARGGLRLGLRTATKEGLESGVENAARRSARDGLEAPRGAGDPMPERADAGRARRSGGAGAPGHLHDGPGIRGGRGGPARLARLTPRTRRDLRDGFPSPVWSGSGDGGRPPARLLPSGLSALP